MSIYIVREGQNAIGMGWWASEQILGDWIDWIPLTCDAKNMTGWHRFSHWLNQSIVCLFHQSYSIFQGIKALSSHTIKYIGIGTDRNILGILFRVNMSNKNCQEEEKLLEQFLVPQFSLNLDVFIFLSVLQMWCHHRQPSSKCAQDTFSDNIFH